MSLLLQPVEAAAEAEPEPVKEKVVEKRGNSKGPAKKKWFLIIIENALMFHQNYICFIFL